MSEECEFAFSSDLTRREVQAILDKSILASELLELKLSDDYRQDVTKDKRYAVSFYTYLFLGTDDEFFEALVALAKELATVASSELYYYPDLLSEEYDDDNTFTIDAEAISHPPGSVAGGRFFRYIIRKS